jgi:hypothetical protein
MSVRFPTLPGAPRTRRCSLFTLLATEENRIGHAYARCALAFEPLSADLPERTRSDNGGQARYPAQGETLRVPLRSRAERLTRLCGAGAPFPAAPLFPPSQSFGGTPKLSNVRPDRRPSFHHRQGNTPLPNRMSIGKLARTVKSKANRATETRATQKLIRAAIATNLRRTPFSVLY